MKMTKIVLFALISLIAATLLETSHRDLVAGVILTAQAAAPEDRKAVDEFNRRFVEGCRKMDHEGAAAMWAQDGVDLLPGMEPMQGQPAIAKWLRGLDEQMRAAKVTQCDVDWQQIEISGDVAYEWGINTQTVSAPDRPEPFKNKGKIVLILRRQADGSWKLALESWNASPQPKS